MVILLQFTYIDFMDCTPMEQSQSHVTQCDASCVIWSTVDQPRIPQLCLKRQGGPLKIKEIRN